MSQYFARDYSGEPFVLFGFTHLAALASIALACLAVCWLGLRLGGRGRRTLRWGLAALVVGSELSWQIWKWQIGEWTIQGMLPLWLCSITAWSIPLLLVFRSYRTYEFVYFMGLIGASQAVLTPDLMMYGFPHFRFIEFFLVHGGIIISVIYMTVVEGFRPVWSSILRAALVMNVYWVLVGLVNVQIGSNYLYTRGKLPTPSLLDVLGPWPWYLLSMEALGLLFCLLLYAPFALRDRR